MKDRFSEATMELASNSAYICTNCESTYGHSTITHLETMSDRDLATEARSVDCILFCDPMPFGD